MGTISKHGELISARKLDPALGLSGGTGLCRQQVSGPRPVLLQLLEAGGPRARDSRAFHLGHLARDLRSGDNGESKKTDQLVCGGQGKGGNGRRTTHT